MTTRRLGFVLLALAAAGCSSTTAFEGEALTFATSTHPELGGPCELAMRRCSRCHPFERVAHAHIREPRQWRDYVHRMRLMPSSGIPPQEETPIAQCLVFRTSGQPGLDELALEERR